MTGPRKYASTVAVVSVVCIMCYVYNYGALDRYYPTLKYEGIAAQEPVTDTTKSVGPHLTRKDTIRKRREHGPPCQNETFTYMYMRQPSMPVEFSQIPRIVYYVWCSNVMEQSYFQFQHFLSLKSAIYFLNPDAVYFYYDRYPDVDEMWYNTWLIELQTIYPFMVSHRIDINSSMCSNDGPNVTSIAAMVQTTGGVYIHTSVVLTEQPAGFVTGAPFIAVSDAGSAIVITAQEGYDILPGVNTRKLSETKCVSVSEYNKPRADTSCVVLGTEGEELYPETTWSSKDTSFHRLTRLLLYGSKVIPAPRSHTHEVIPRIAHYNFFGGGRMDFLFYLSVLSCLHVANLQVVYIHGDLPPGGMYWKRFLQPEYQQKVKWIKRYRPNIIYGKTLLSVAHEADVSGSDVILKYGGVHVDPDLLIIQPFDESLWRYEAVFGLDNKKRNPFPKAFNWGISLGAPGSEFWQLVQQSQRCFAPEEWHWNSARLVYKIYERNPHLAVQLNKLQVICSGKGEIFTHWLSDQDNSTSKVGWQWKEHVQSIHYVHGNRAFRDFNSATKDQSVHGALARKVLRAAGLLQPNARKRSD